MIRRVDKSNGRKRPKKKRTTFPKSKRRANPFYTYKQSKPIDRVVVFRYAEEDEG